MNSFTDRFHQLWALGAVVTSTGPLALWLTTGLVPPWPRGSGIVTTIFCALGVVCVYSVGTARKKSSGLMAEKLIGTALILLGLAGVFWYLYLDATYVIEVEQPTASDEVNYLRFVIGDSLAPGVNYDRPAVLLANQGYDPFAVWTRASVAKAQLLVVTSFLLTFMALSAGMAVLALHPTAETRPPRPAKDP